MVEAYCGTCDTVTSQERVNVLFGALPLGNCSACHSTNPLMETLPRLFTSLLGDEFRAYQEKRVRFEGRSQ